MTQSDSELPAPPRPLPSVLRLLVGLAALCATTHSSDAPTSTTLPSQLASQASTWLAAVLKLLELDASSLPSSVSPDAVRASADGQRRDWSQADVARMAGVLVEASLVPENAAAPAGRAGGALSGLVGGSSKADKSKPDDVVRYTAVSRALAHRALTLLGLDARTLLPAAEKRLASTLYDALKAASEAADKEVESTRAAHGQGWGGSLGRHLGVIAGGVLLGVTGGLAAPAIAAVLAPLGIGGILSASAAPVVLGTLFGVGGGGLAGRRVRERWRGVEEFGFVEIGAGTRPTKDEVDDLRAARKSLQGDDGEAVDVPYAVRQKRGSQSAGTTPSSPNAAAETKQDDGKPIEPDGDAHADVEASRRAIQEQLLALSQEAGTGPTLASSSPTSRPSLDSASATDEDTAKKNKRAPSLTATIVVPGLLSASKTEGITAWRAICAERHIDKPLSAAIGGAAIESDAEAEREVDAQAQEFGRLEISGRQMEHPLSLSDGRDIYLLRYETATMLKTGRDIDLWVTSKLKGLVKKEIIKRTILSAYFAAVSLPLTAYTMATMTLDNTWMHAQDRAVKAGRLLGEVLEKKVQGERPVILIGSSVGALTVLHALLYLSTLDVPPKAAVVESAHLISLPSAPSADEWRRARSVVSRRLTNVWTESDLVLAGVVRMHEIVSRAAMGGSGIRVAGLGPVEQAGVEDVDVSSVLRGHLELQTKMPEVLRIIDVDA